MVVGQFADKQTRGQLTRELDSWWTDYSTI